MSNTPVVLQDVWHSTGVRMSVPSILRLAETSSQVQVTKEQTFRRETIASLRIGQDGGPFRS